MNELRRRLWAIQLEEGRYFLTEELAGFITRAERRNLFVDGTPWRLSALEALDDGLTLAIRTSKRSPR